MSAYVPLKEILQYAAERDFDAGSSALHEEIENLAITMQEKVLIVALAHTEKVFAYAHGFGDAALALTEPREGVDFGALSLDQAVEEQLLSLRRVVRKALRRCADAQTDDPDEGVID